MFIKTSLNQQIAPSIEDPKALLDFDSYYIWNKFNLFSYISK